MSLTPPSSDDLERIANKYAGVRPDEYLAPAQLLRELIRDVQEVAFPFVEYLNMRARDLIDSVNVAADQYIAADKPGRRVSGELKQTTENIAALDKEVKELRRQIAAATTSEARAALSKKIQFAITELDLASVRLARFSETLEHSQKRIRALQPKLKDLESRINAINDQFRKALRWLMLLRGLQFAALTGPIAAAFAITLVLDRFSLYLEGLLQIWVHGKHHDAVLLGIFAVQVFCFTPLLDRFTAPFWGQTFERSVERFRELAGKLGTIDVELTKMAAESGGIGRE